MFVSLQSLGEKRRRIDALEAEWLSDLAVYDRAEDFRVDGYYSATMAIADECHMDRGVASGMVKLARKLEKLPVVAAAFAAGEISLRHASVIATAATERMAEFSNLEEEFVEVARKCPPKELAQVVEYVTDALDGDGGVEREAEVYDRRRYKQSSTLDGMLAVDALLDPESAKFHEDALRIARERDAREGETRSQAQRNADASTMISRQWLELTDANTPDHVRQQLIAVVDLAETPEVGPELIEQARSERRRDGRVSRTTLERIACDANLSRVLMVGPSEVLDLGRTTRTATNAQFRALIARDRHCQGPGCKEPPNRCQAHHTWHWIHGGPTDLDNLELLCWHHHRQRHIDDGSIRAPDGERRNCFPIAPFGPRARRLGASERA